ncbi:hypothetical protein GCM10009347_36100 [Shewanella algicola]|uniref:Lipoprotein n=1 Tax=Shewanella algicola TaxID=640633 RepID=A0A9X2CA87_9GAMM|nr:hypothetical protein [Shewanella algicola]MCL1104619.1 hypothetical protein [Shewanella algicola]GGP67454.1 hypothetical protein GCM10009347_36100 [Shewanella algicola]
MHDDKTSCDYLARSSRYFPVLVVAASVLLSGCSSVLCQAQTDNATDPLSQYDQQKKCEQLVNQHIDDERRQQRLNTQQLLDESIQKNTH